MYVNRLGNQALLRASNNSNVRSAGFVAKQRLYQQSPYILTSMIAELADWTPTAVAERQTKLANLAVVAWPI